MTPPTGSPAPAATERRLAVLLSHLSPLAPPPARGPGGADRYLLEAGGLAAFPCAGDEKGESWKGGFCIFCAIVNGTKPSFKLYEDDVCLCILDKKPLSPGHCLIIPKEHFPTLHTTPPSVVAAMCSKLPVVANAVMKTTKFDAFNVLVNNGLEAGQEIFHTHFHIIPRKDGDGLWPSTGYRRNEVKDSQETRDFVSCVKELVSSSPEDFSTEGSAVPKEL